MLSLTCLVDIAFCVFYYLFATLAYFTRSFSFYNWFQTIALLGMFDCMLLAYINK